MNMYYLVVQFAGNPSSTLITFKEEDEKKAKESPYFTQVIRPVDEIVLLYERKPGMPPPNNKPEFNEFWFEDEQTGEIIILANMPGLTNVCKIISN